MTIFSRRVLLLLIRSVMVVLFWERHSFLILMLFLIMSLLLSSSISRQCPLWFPALLCLKADNLRSLGLLFMSPLIANSVIPFRPCPSYGASPLIPMGPHLFPVPLNLIFTLTLLLLLFIIKTRRPTTSL